MYIRGLEVGERGWCERGSWESSHLVGNPSPTCEIVHVEEFEDMDYQLHWKQMKEENKHVSDSNDLMNQHFYWHVVASETTGINDYFDLELREIGLPECNSESL